MKYETHIDLAEFSEVNAERCNKSFHLINAWSLSDWARTAAGKLGEAYNLIKKLNCGEDISYDDIAEELADCVTHIDLLLTKMDKELAYELIKKFNIVSKRVNSSKYLIGIKGE